MKYTILGFQQSKLVEANLDVEDAFLLRTIKDMYSSVSMEFISHEGQKYMWINYTYLLEQLPIMGSKRNIMRKIERYGNELYILRVLKHERKGQRGNYSYICPTEKLDLLQDFDLMTESHKGYDKNDIRVMTESHNKDSSIKDSSIKDNKESGRFTPPTLEEVSDYCLERKNGVDPQRFIDYNQSKGWIIGKSKMKDWKAAVRTWEQKENKTVRRVVDF